MVMLMNIKEKKRRKEDETQDDKKEIYVFNNPNYFVGVLYRNL